MQHLLAISGLINGLVAIFFGLLVIFNNRKSIINQTVFLLTVATAIWSFGYWRWLSEYHNPEIAFFWIIVLSIGSLFIPIFYFHWILTLLNLEQKYKRALYFFYSVSIIYLPLVPTSYFISSVAPIGQFAFWPRAGILHIFYLLFVYLLLVLFSIYLLIKNFPRVDSTKKQQIKYILAGSLIGFSGGATNFFYWYDIHFLPIASILVGTYPVIFTYSIIKHRLMDIRLVARKYLVISAYIATIGAFFILSKQIFSLFIAKEFEELLDLTLLVISILFTSPIKGFYFRLANKYFFSSLYDSSKLIAEVSEGLRSTIELDKILALISGSLKKTLHLKAFGVLHFSEKDCSYSVGYNDGFDIGKKQVFPSDRYLHKYYTRTNQPIIVEELIRENNPQCARTIEMLKKIGVEILIPLNIKDETIGLLVLGKKEAGDIYNDVDFKALKVISSQAAVAIDNAKLYDEVSKFNETLQEKVDAQTKDIQAKAEHLKKLMDMRSEFLDITSHQLRTPVSVIKGVLSMLEEGSIPPARVKEFIRGAMEKAIKLGEIINDILRASEMDTDKFTMTIRPVDLNEMLEKIKEDKRRTAEMRNIAMVYEFPANIPLVLTDPKYVEHAIVNLINNSLQYTVEGSITTSVEVTKTHVIVRVSDTGIGIPPEALPKLFGKFARAENAVTTFTDGTGLGLFIIKQIVDANPGAKIEVERTEVGKGTTFALWLPIATDPKAAPIKTSAK